MAPTQRSAQLAWTSRLLNEVAVSHPTLINLTPAPVRMPTDPRQVAPADRAAEASAESPVGSDGSKTSYGQILKSSAWIGGSSVLTIAIGIVRTKAMAVMLGPSGFGLMGLYGAIIDLGLAAASMGIGNAGVRQIAESVASGDEARLARTVVVLRRTAVVLGILGVTLLAAFSNPVSTLTFGNEEQAGAVALLGLAVFFRLVSAGQAALIQGMRRIHDLAVMGVVGALLGAAISIALVYLFREQGVAPSLVAGAAMGLVDFLVVRPKGGDSTSGNDAVRSDSRKQTSLLKLGIRLHAEWTAHDGGVLCGPRHHPPHGWP